MINGTDELRSMVGGSLGTSPWIEIDQLLVDRFAEVTGDRYWAHTDPARCEAESPLGTTIAHGLLTLSQHPRLLYDLVEFRGFAQLLNYGYERVRFPAPLPTGTRVRMTAELKAVEESQAGTRATILLTFEGERTEKPVCVAEFVLLLLTWRP